MKNPFSKLRKNDEGFTLVELIVVIVILAILIGVTIAGVTKYIGQSRKNTDINNASSMTSVLSVLAADEDVYKKVKAGGPVATVTSSALCTTDALAATSIAASLPDCGDALKAELATKIAELLPDGLPKSQTGDGFKISITVTEDADDATKGADLIVKVIAVCDE